MLRKFSKILVVDDSPTMLRLVCGMLHSLGLENIESVGDGDAALSLFSMRRYALVISDWQMEPMNGLDLLRELRKRDPIFAVPFILMTAHTVRFANVARDAGAIHYLPKPFDQKQLAAKIVQATVGAVI